MSTRTEKAQAYVDWVLSHDNTPPNRYSDNEDERKLYNWYRAYTNGNNGVRQYDDVNSILSSLPPALPKYIQRANEYIQWYKSNHNSHPSLTSDDTEEKRLAKWLQNNRNNSTIQDYIKSQLELKNSVLNAEQKAIQQATRYVEWTHTYNKRPKRTKVSCEEQKLANWHRNYMSKQKHYASVDNILATLS